METLEDTGYMMALLVSTSLTMAGVGIVAVITRSSKIAVVSGM